MTVSGIIQMLRIHFFLVCLFAITLFISIVNYQHGTWLTGWDTLHPEFDFSLNFSRIIDGVWREEQGLGAVATHAHMSELPRYLLLWIISWIAPLSSLRYIYVFLCFVSGPLGMYFFLRHILKKSDHHRDIVNASAFLGSLFYIFNLAVLHTYLVPFEMFTTQYALLPWLFFFASNYLDRPSYRTLLYFSIATFFSTPMAYAFQLWYVYAGSFAVFLLLSTMLNKSPAMLKRSALLLVVTAGINAYWLLPHLYFLFNTAAYIPQAHANILFSERMFAFNQARSSIWDVMLLQGALYDWSKFDGQGFIPLFSLWKNHIEHPFTLAIGFVLFAMVIVGLIRQMYQKNHTTLALLPVGIICFIVLANANWPFDLFFSWVRENASLLKEGLRSPYTKFSLMLLLVYAVFFSYAQPIILELLHKKIRKYYILVITLILMIYMYPFLTGNLIDRSMKVQIPTHYFELFNWFKKQPADTRIAVFPVHSFWGWEYHRWGYQGAGFLWFGLPQSLLVRDFDRWNPHNENFYWEFSYAVYAKRSDLIKKVMRKYRVKWLLVDNSIISPPNPKSLYFDEMKNMLEEVNGEIVLVKKIGGLSVYEDMENNSISTRIASSKTVTAGLSNVFQWTNNDRGYQEYGDHISSQHDQFDVIYPFSSLFTGRAITNTSLNITKDANTYLMRSRIRWTDEVNTAYYLESDDTGVMNIYDTYLNPNNSARTDLIPHDGYLTARIPVLSDYYTYDSSVNTFESLPQTRCDSTLKGPIERYPISGGGMRFTSENASNCLDIRIPQLDHQYSYLIEVTAENKHGLPLFFSVQNIDSNRSEIETYLPRSLTTSYFIIPPLASDGRQYAFHFDNLSIGDKKTVNDLYHVRVQRFPYTFLQSLKLKSRTNEPLSKEVFVLAQNYNAGWQAYTLSCPSNNLFCKLKRLIPSVFGQKLTQKVEINNWANGWIAKQNETGQFIAVIFWPQYLQYLGYVLLICTLFYVARSRHHSSSPPSHSTKQIRKEID